jgi:hypothetical protein
MSVESKVTARFVTGIHENEELRQLFRERYYLPS